LRSAKLSAANRICYKWEKKRKEQKKEKEKRTKLQVREKH
jgi:hypothetical protein